MKYLLILSIFIVSIFANDLKKDENSFYIKDKYQKEINFIDDYKKIPKIKKEFFAKDNVEVNGSITIEHTF